MKTDPVIKSTAVLERIDSETMGSQKLFDRAQKSFPSGSTRAPFYGPPYPLYIRRAQGCYVWDVDGNKYLDFVNNYGPLVLGHRHPEVEKAVIEQVHSFWCGGPTESEILLAEEILRAFPMVDKVAFAPSGTEAVLRLVRAIRASTEKKKLAMSTGAFHGTSDSVSSGAGVLPEVESQVARFRYNDIESVRAVLKNTKGELAAVFLEAVLGAAGSVPPSREFVKTLREETERAGVLLVFDEIVTGFRLARGGISELYKVNPDCILLGKIIGGGFPVGALSGPAKVMNEFSFPKAPPPPLVGRPRLYGGGTFNAHPVTMAAGLATLQVLKPDVYESLNNFGTRVRTMLSKAAQEAKIQHSVTGIGSIFRLHFTAEPIVDYESARSSDERRGRIFDLLLRSKFVNMARFHTSFCSTPMGNEEFRLFEEAIMSSLSELESVDL